MNASRINSKSGKEITRFIDSSRDHIGQSKAQMPSIYMKLEKEPSIILPTVLYVDIKISIRLRVDLHSNGRGISA